MSVFNTIAKLWPDGTQIGGASSHTFTIDPSHQDQEEETAAQFATSLDGTQNYQFLFWNTGRHVTNKRKVRWHFSVPGWGTWTATKWYARLSGIDEVPSGPPRVRADAFTISDDMPLSGTPIDPSASTYPAGAYPLPPPPGNDHAIGTTAGDVHVVAKDPFPFGPPSLGPTKLTVVKGVAEGPPFLQPLIFSYSVSSYDFAGWLRLVCGGDSVGEFLESDTLPDGSSAFGVYDHLVGGVFPVDKSESADLIAVYGIGTHYVTFSPPLRDWIYKVPFPDLPRTLDPSGPIWLKLFQQLMLETEPGLFASTDFERLIKEVPQMNREALQRAMQSVKTTLNRGEAALSAIETYLRRGDS